MHKINIEHLPVTFYFTTDRKKYAKKTKIEVEEGVAGLCTVNYTTQIICIGVFNGTVRTIAHEVFHAIMFMSEIMQSPVDLSTNEHNAYLMGHIAEKCHAIMMTSPP